MENYSERRKNFYINKRFQGEFIVKFCVLVLLGSLISAVIVYMMTSSTVTTVFENSKLTIKSTADFIMPAVLLASAIVFILVGLATIAITLFTSHRIAGPLYRIEKDINQVTSGKLTTVFHLREGDEIKPIAESLGLMTASLREKISEIKKNIEEIESSAVSGGAALPDDVKIRIRRIKETIGKFTV